jgi:3-oxoacyl-ACP reductase-like protein
VTELALTKMKRFEQVSEAIRFVDNVVDQYAQKLKITIPKRSQCSSQSSTNTHTGVIDSTALRNVESRVKRMVQNQIESMRHYLQSDNSSTTKTLPLISKSSSELLNTNKNVFPPQHQHPHSNLHDVFENEYGFDHAKRIAPKFKPNTVRSYSSSWNWGVQDALYVFFFF